MKYFEYVYLVLAGMTLVFLFKEGETLTEQGIYSLWGVIGLFVVMFIFRRYQRARAEKKYVESQSRFNQEDPEELKNT